MSDDTARPDGRRESGAADPVACARLATEPFGGLLRDAPVGYQALDVRGHLLDVNETWLAMLGYERGDVVGRPFAELLAPAQRDLFDRLTAAARREGHAFQELDVRRADDTLRHVRVDGHAAYDTGRRFLGVYCVLSDLDGHQRIEAELRDREEQLQAVSDNSPFGMHRYQLEDDGRLVFTGWNRTAEALLGLDHTPLVGLTLEEAFPGNTGTETAAAFYRVAREGGTYEAEDYAYDAAGVSGVFELHAFRFGPRRMAVFFRDISDRRRLEIVARESEMRYHALFEHMQEGFALCEMVYDERGDPVDWVYLEANPAFSAISGALDVKGRSAREVFPGLLERNPGLLVKYAAVADGTPAEFESFFAPRRVWLHINAFSPAPGQFAAMFEDVTLRRRSEDALAERERMLSTLLGNLPGMAYRCANDEDWTDEFASAGALDLLGYSAEAKIDGSAPSMMQQVHADDLARIRRETADAVARDEHWEYQYRIFTPDGTLRWVRERGVGVRDESGRAVALEGFIQDVTAERENEAQLAAAATLWQHTFDAMRDSVAVFDAEGRLVRANTATAARTGHAAEETIGRPCYEVFHGTDGFTEGCPFRRSRDTHAVEELVLEQDGSWSRVTFQPLLGADGEFLGGVHVVRDISEQMRGEQDLRESLARLEVMTEGAIATLARAVEVRDPYTAGHQRRVSQLAEAIAARLGLDAERVRGVRVAGMVHDVGKIVVPAEILAKPGHLSATEYELIKRHSREGFDVLSGIEFPWPVAEVALQHHERLDGSGYPLGLDGADILEEARIVAVADVVEAMASHRPYRPAQGIEAALREIEMHAGRLYDAAACAACLSLFNRDGFAFEEDEGMEVVTEDGP